jgi:hypothetical protein
MKRLTRTNSPLVFAADRAAGTGVTRRWKASADQYLYYNSELWPVELDAAIP